MRRTNLIFIILLLAGLSFNVSAQKGYKTAKAGVGLNGIRVGKSTRADVIKKYGRGFKTLKNGSYSVQMKYRNGISFYYCNKDRQQEIFVIEMRAPAKIKTAKGIILSKSNKNQLRKKYGKPKKGLRFKGIEFYHNKRNIITVIDIVENKGMRQCK